MFRSYTTALSRRRCSQSTHEVAIRVTNYFCVYDYDYISRRFRAEREPITGVWGQSPQGLWAEPLVRGSGAKPP